MKNSRKQIVSHQNFISEIKKLVEVSKQQIGDYGNSFSEKNVRRMMQFASILPNKENDVSLIRQLTRSHILALIPIDQWYFLGVIIY